MPLTVQQGQSHQLLCRNTSCNRVCLVQSIFGIPEPQAQPRVRGAFAGHNLLQHDSADFNVAATSSSSNPRFSATSKTLKEEHAAILTRWQLKGHINDRLTAKKLSPSMQGDNLAELLWVQKGVLNLINRTDIRSRQAILAASPPPQSRPSPRTPSSETKHSLEWKPSRHFREARPHKATCGALVEQVRRHPQSLPQLRNLMRNVEINFRRQCDGCVRTRAASAPVGRRGLWEVHSAQVLSPSHLRMHGEWQKHMSWSGAT